MNYAKLKQIKKTYFSHQDISKSLGITSESAKVTCARLIKRGILIRIKRDLYILRDVWDALSREDKFIIANIIQVPSYISLMTAMDYYQITTQMQHDFIESVGIYRTKEMEVEKNIFNYSKINKDLYFGFVKEKGFFIATPEKALLDAFYFMSLKRYSFDSTSIDFDKINKNKMQKLVRRFPERTQRLLKELWIS